MTLLIRSASPPELASQHWVPTSEPNTYLGDGLSPVPEGATLLGEWAQDGTLINADAAPGGVGTPLMVPGLILDPETGETSPGLVPMSLAFHHYMGHAPRVWVSEQFPPSDFSPQFSEEFL